MENESNFKSGALPDLRSAADKAKDYHFEEIVATVNPVNWIEKPQAVWRKFPIFNQNGSGSCVSQTLAKLFGVLYWLKNQIYVHFSATHIYQRRVNKPAGGMAGVDAFNIARKGVTLEELVPSQNLTDQQMDSTVIPQYKQDVGAVFKIPNYVELPVKDIETVASVIQTTGKAVMVWFYFQYDEWTERPVIKNITLDLNAPATCRHSITAVDFTLYQGKKALIVEDSWGPGYGLGGQRIIDEDFFKIRNWFAAYPINFKFDEQQIVKPEHTFTLTMRFGETNEEIKILQDCLKYEGLFPLNVESTGFYGAVTAKGVMAFQTKYGVAPTEEIQKLRGRTVGLKTISKLNEIYG